MRWTCLCLLLTGLLRAQEPPPTANVATVRDAAALDAALADRTIDILDLYLAATDLTKPQQNALRAWVERGGTLATRTDAVTLFGFQAVAARDAERPVHGRRTIPVDAMPLVAGVRDVWLTLPADGVLLTGHPSALPLLSVADPVAVYRESRFAAALLYWGRGQVLHVGGVPHPTRGQAETWLASLVLTPNRFNDLAQLPLETLRVAQQRLDEARQQFSRKPDEAKALLNQVFLAFRLWYGDELTARGDFDRATSVLAGVAQELPEDPAVYLAVARLNEALGRTMPAAEARALAAERYQTLKRDPPGPDAPQVRVDWSLFAEAVNAVGRAWENPTQAALDQAVARTDHLLALDDYRRGRLTAAEALLKDAAALYRGWGPPLHLRGLLELTRGDTLTRASRDRAASYRAAAAWFDQAGQAQVAADYPQPEQDRAKAWAETCRTLAEAAALEPPDVELRGGVIIRLNNADRRLQVGPLRESLLSGYAEAYQTVGSWGVWPSDLEVLVYDDTFKQAAAMPTEGVVPQAFSNAAVVGRRILAVAESNDLFRMSRHAVAHVMLNALTEDGLPAPLWFSEGVAWGAQERATELQLARVNIRRGTVMAIQQINDPEVFYDRRNVDHGHGQAQLMVNALVNRFGRGILVDLPQSTGWGETPEAAFRRLTGMTQEQFLTAMVQGRMGDL